MLPSNDVMSQISATILAPQGDNSKIKSQTNEKAEGNLGGIVEFLHQSRATYL